MPGLAGHRGVWCRWCFEAWYDCGLTCSDDIREQSLKLQKDH
jgi:hypothetical protein